MFGLSFASLMPSTVLNCVESRWVNGCRGWQRSGADLEAEAIHRRRATIGRLSSWTTEEEIIARDAIIFEVSWRPRTRGRPTRPRCFIRLSIGSRVQVSLKKKLDTSTFLFFQRGRCEKPMSKAKDIEKGTARELPRGVNSAPGSPCSRPRATPP